MSPNASHRVRPGLSSAASLIATLLISFDQEVLNQHLNLVTPEYPFFESPWPLPGLASTRRSEGEPRADEVRFVFVNDGVEQPLAVLGLLGRDHRADRKRA